MNVIHRIKLKRIQLTLATGDLFDAKVDAIVSSEQTDFVLSGNPASLSGQIWLRYGDTIQQELDEATNGEVLGAGTVIQTSGGLDFKRIFHAGFHDPDDWPSESGQFVDVTDDPNGSTDSRETDYFTAIGRCITQVLDLTGREKLESVAFPLIGCGVFGLDERMLVLQFLDAIEEFDDRCSEGECLNVWLVIHRRAQFESIAGSLLDLLLRARREMAAVRVKPCGVPILDRFALRLSERTNEEWAKWQLCRYAEIALQFMCFGLSRAMIPVTSPQTLFEEGRAPTFGTFHEVAQRLATSSTLRDKSWGARFFAGVVLDKTAKRALAAINEQRNALAHGRKSESIAVITKCVMQGLQLDSWSRIPNADGELRLADWGPWVGTASPGTDQMGLFERWQKNTLRYLVPETGEIFKISRGTECR